MAFVYSKEKGVRDFESDFVDKMDGAVLLTLIDNVKAGLVLGVVTVEEESGLMGGAEQRAWHHWAAEPINHRPRFQVPTPHFQVVVDRLCGEVQELQVDP